MSFNHKNESKSLPDILDNRQIDEAFINPKTGLPIKRYGGCFLSDEISKKTPERKVYVVNLDSVKNHSATDEDIGSHWVGISNIAPNQIIYVDSFGLPPNESTLAFLRKAKKSNGERKRIIYSTCAVQNADSEACGWFTIYCLKQLLKKRSLINILLDDFSLIDTWRNDYLVKKIYDRQYFDEIRD